jgi:hypothetical protein
LQPNGAVDPNRQERQLAMRGSLRASDADREQVAEHLRRAAAEGRLRTDELEQRLGAAFSALTYGELDPLIADLPRTPDRRQANRAPTAVVIAGYAAVIAVVILAVMAVVLIATSLFALWAVWIIFGWAFLGGRRRRLARARQHQSAYWAGHGRRPVQPGRQGFWL